MNICQPESSLRSSSRLIICACIDTSSDANPSDQELGRGRKAARDAKALALAPELVRVAVKELCPKPGSVKQLRYASDIRLLPCFVL